MKRCWILGVTVLSCCLSLTAIRAGAWDGEHTTDPLDKVLADVQAHKAVLVDAREHAEWNRGHIKGAALIPLSELINWDKDGQFTAEEKAEVAKRIPAGKVVYIHCAAGGRCVPAAGILKQLGYDVRPLKPGYADLIKAGFPKAE